MIELGVLRRALDEHLASAGPVELEDTLDLINERLADRAGTRGGLVTAAIETVRQLIRLTEGRARARR